MQSVPHPPNQPGHLLGSTGLVVTLIVEGAWLALPGFPIPQTPVAQTWGNESPHSAKYSGKLCGEKGEVLARLFPQFAWQQGGQNLTLHEAR